jgi:hypothetical protein
MYEGDEYNQGYQGQEEQGGFQQQRGYGQQQTEGYQQNQQGPPRGGYQGRGRGRGGYRGGRGGGQGGQGGQGYQQRENGPSVFVGNIPWAATEEELTTIFSDFGNVIRFRILQDRESGRSRGMNYCFEVTWSTQLHRIDREPLKN